MTTRRWTQKDWDRILEPLPPRTRRRSVEWELLLGRLAIAGIVFAFWTIIGLLVWSQAR